MSDMPVVLTGQRLPLPLIEGLAPDNGTWRAADRLAREGQVRASGCLVADDSWLLWAAFPEGRRPDALASVLLPQLYVTCTCGGARFPCRHVLALLLLDATDAASDHEKPPWVTARLDSARRAMRATTSPTESDARIAVAAAGMAELARWLGDQLDRGLASLPAAGPRPWHAAADRLADAYAPAAARELRQLAALPGSGSDWPERLLPRLGRLALLADAFGRRDTLAPGERGDVLAATGLPPRPGNDRIGDTWLALGRRQLVEGGQRQIHTWLRGLSSGRWALLEAYQPAKRLEGLGLPTGARFTGELAFAPGAWPLLAQPVDGLRLELAAPEVTPTDLPGHDIAAAVADYAAARAANPWLRLLPMLLHDVFVEPAPAGWRLRDRGGRLLPLPPRYGHGWALLALAGDRPLTLCGEYDGATLMPLSVYHDGWRDPAAWKALP